MKSVFAALCLSATCSSVIFLSACSKPTGAPALPTTYQVSLPNTKTRVTFVQWENGLQVCFADNYQGHRTSGHSSSSSPFTIKKGETRSDNKTGYRWQIKTRDGKSCELTIDKNTYDLSKGSFFVIHETENKVVVDQYQQTLPSSIESTNDLINELKKIEKLKEWTKVLQ